MQFTPQFRKPVLKIGLGMYSSSGRETWEYLQSSSALRPRIPAHAWTAYTCNGGAGGAGGAGSGNTGGAGGANADNGGQNGAETLVRARLTGTAEAEAEAVLGAAAAAFAASRRAAGADRPAAVARLAAQSSMSAPLAPNLRPPPSVSGPSPFSLHIPIYLTDAHFAPPHCCERDRREEKCGNDGGTLAGVTDMTGKPHSLLSAKGGLASVYSGATQIEEPGFQRSNQETKDCSEKRGQKVAGRESWQAETLASIQAARHEYWVEISIAYIRSKCQSNSPMLGTAEIKSPTTAAEADAKDESSDTQNNHYFTAGLMNGKIEYGTSRAQTAAAVGVPRHEDRILNDGSVLGCHFRIHRPDPARASAGSQYGA
ncbi:hypothetical protein B0H17DRAFT_1138876 [Mycena rosella]|uniref:Uncharacterized protein n=1 Tax=Mycena rosella TaxID=1033263 RepID=A0AAD7D930_MYCRO|nr:hypothetical protein B0H17DRAFT_1138876 [Mycena rosella]